jgi:hypothetical protein
MTQTQFIAIVVALSLIAIVTALLARRRKWSGRVALSIAALPLGGLGLCFVFC